MDEYRPLIELTVKYIVIPIILVVMVILVTKITDIKLVDIFLIFLREFKDLLRIRPTLGAINFAGLIIVSVVGMLLIFGDASRDVIDILKNSIGTERLEGFEKSLEPTVVFICVFIVTLVSIVAVFLNEVGRSRSE